METEMKYSTKLRALRQRITKAHNRIAKHREGILEELALLEELAATEQRLMKEGE